ncbi:MAG: hypothetical protein BWK78_07415 [Thiotrichaceae bacterium IS1]|nr:MAG: hypothetical protein BWK78_07415 [Thiotrichaceae bacterium IS1]
MQTIAFETHAPAGIIRIPETFQDWYGKTLKVILLRDETPIPATYPPNSVPQLDSATLMKERFEAPPGDSVSHLATPELAKEIGLEGEALETFLKIMAISKHCAALPDLDTRSPDEILGYNEFGGFD